MSRYYEALREASRFRRKADGAVEEPEPEAVESAGAATPGEQEAIPPNSAGRVQEDWAIPQDPLGPGLAPGSGSSAQPAAMVLDPKARLIPHAIDTVVVEHYRRLRTKIMQAHAAQPFRSLMVASPGPQEGKTVTVLNLALSFAMLPSLKVLVVDGDLRRGSVGKWLGVDDTPGLSNVLDGSARFEDVVLQCEGLPVHFVLRGNSKLPAAELLHSAGLGNHFRKMTEHYSLVLVDTPPVNLLADAQLIAAHCDAVLLIARAFSTSRKELEKAVRDISRFRVIGTVLNGGVRTRLYGKYGGYY